MSTQLVQKYAARPDEKQQMLLSVPGIIDPVLATFIRLERNPGIDKLEDVYGAKRLCRVRVISGGVIKSDGLEEVHQTFVVSPDTPLATLNLNRPCVGTPVRAKAKSVRPGGKRARKLAAASAA